MIINTFVIVESNLMILFDMNSVLIHIAKSIESMREVLFD